MNWYEFKLNFQYSYVNEYSKDLKSLISEFVINLYDLFTVSKIKDNYYDLYNSNINKKDFENKFKQLKDNTEKLYQEYQEIYDKFMKNNEIFYSSEFLKLKNKCGKMRNILEKEYPMIDDIYNLYTDNNIIEQFSLKLSNNIGTGIQHFKKFYKLLAYVNDNGYSAFSNYSLEHFQFDATNEYFYFKASNDEEACVQANYLENILNKNIKFNNRFGIITILPMYDTLQIEENPTKFEYTIVFPNGNPDIINEAKQKNIDYAAQEITVDLAPEQGKKLDKNNINKKILSKNANGYLKRIKCKGAKLIKKIRTNN